MSKSKDVPLEKQEFPVLDPKTDELVYRHVLHPDLCQKTLSGVEYYAPPHHFNENAHELKQYVPVLNEIIADLQWLLMLNYAKFWCQVVNDDSVHALLNSYLRRAPRYNLPNLPDYIQRKHDHVHRLVFLVFHRMSTPKESKTDFMSPEYFGNLIYDNFLFDIPRLMDVCALYGNPQNTKLVRKLVHSVFESQPSYVTDLQQAAKTVVQVLTHTEQKCSETGDENIPTSLNDGLPVTSVQGMTDLEFSDLIRFLSDIMFTLKSFLVDVYPRSTSKFFEVDLVGKLSSVYCETLKTLKSDLRRRKSSITYLVYCELNTHLKITADSILDIVHHIIKLCLFDPILKSSKDGNINKDGLAEKYLEALTTLLSQPLFINALHQKYDLARDVDAVVQACPGMEGAQSNFIITSLREAPPAIKEKVQSIKQKSYTKEKPAARKKDPLPTKQIDVERMNNDDDLKMVQLISTVQDLFDDLGSPFIEACLKRFDMDPEKVIQMILDDNLPPDIQQMERSASKPHIKPKEESSSAETKAVEENQMVQEEIPGTSGIADILKERKNVYDNDEFDVMVSSSSQKSVDKSKVHRGKRDKSDIEHWGSENEFQRLKELYNKYDLVTDGQSDEEEFAMPVITSEVYEDEYDDTYDDVKVSANDLDNADELLARRLRAQKMVRDEDSDEDSDEPGSVKMQNIRQNFIENPEVVRARKEAARERRQEEFQRKIAKRRSHQNDKQHRHPPTEGDERDTRKRSQVKDRKSKEVNKSGRANHNRKNLATKKALQGM